jgi:hypothetical protein
MAEEKKEVYLDADKEIPGQHFVCLSFLSPEKVLANKDVYLFSEFLKDYEVQYKIKSTETFLMAQMNKLQGHASKLQDIVAGVSTGEPTKEELEKAYQAIKDERILISKDITTDLEAHVKANLADYKQTSIQDAYETFLFKNRKRLEDDFFAKNDFRTTIRGLKVRGTYDTYNEALMRAKTLQKLDPAFNVYVGQVGFWLPWDPEPSEVQDQEYADDQLNQLMKKYKENESQRDEFFEEMKRKRIGDKTPRAEAAPVGASNETPTAMFEGEDLALRRKKEQADTISHA